MEEVNSGYFPQEEEFVLCTECALWLKLSFAVAVLPSSPGLCARMVSLRSNSAVSYNLHWLPFANLQKILMKLS